MVDGGSFDRKQSRGEHKESAENDIVYSDVISREDVPLTDLEVALENTRDARLINLLARLPNQKGGVGLTKDSYFDNVWTFTGLWYRTAQAINPRKRLITRRPKPSDFLPTEAAVGILSDSGIIPADAPEVGHIILQNSVATDYSDANNVLRDADREKCNRYALFDATRDGVAGYALRCFVMMPNIP